MSDDDTEWGRTTTTRSYSDGALPDLGVGDSFNFNRARVRTDVSGSASLRKSSHVDTVCTICDSRLGKRYMKPVHHCKLCGRIVCGKCSPSMLQLAGSGDKLQRACTTCVAGTLETSEIKLRLHRISEQLATACSAASRSSSPPPGPACTLMEAVDVCDKVADTVEQRLRSCTAAKLRADALARQAGAKLEQGVRDRKGLEEALSACEESIAETEARARDQRTRTTAALQSLHLRIQQRSRRSSSNVPADGAEPVEALATLEEGVALCEASLSSLESQLEHTHYLACCARPLAECPVWNSLEPQPEPVPPYASPPASEYGTPASSFGSGHVAVDSRGRQGCVKGCHTQ